MSVHHHLWNVYIYIYIIYCDKSSFCCVDRPRQLEIVVSVSFFAIDYISYALLLQHRSLFYDTK